MRALKLIILSGIGFILGLIVLDLVFDSQYQRDKSLANLETLTKYYQNNILKAGKWNFVILGSLLISNIGFIVYVFNEKKLTNKIIYIVLSVVLLATFVDISRAQDTLVYKKSNFKDQPDKIYRNHLILGVIQITLAILIIISNWRKVQAAKPNNIKMLLCVSIGFLLAILTIDIVQDQQIHSQQGIEFYSTYYYVTFKNFGNIGVIMYSNIVTGLLLFLAYLYVVQELVTKIFMLLLNALALYFFFDSLKYQIQIADKTAKNLLENASVIEHNNLIIFGIIAFTAFTLILRQQPQKTQDKKS